MLHFYELDDKMLFLFFGLCSGGFLQRCGYALGRKKGQFFPAGFDCGHSGIVETETLRHPIASIHFSIGVKSPKCGQFQKSSCMPGKEKLFVRAGCA